MHGRDDIKDWLALVSLPGLGSVHLHRLLTVFNSPAELLAAGRAIVEVPGIDRHLADIFTSPARIKQARSWAEQEFCRVRAANIRLLRYSDPLYPSLLRTIHNFPVLLYCSGDTEVLRNPAVAVVGSRTPTDYGKTVASQLARQLAGSGVVVVSGLAKGIDGRAHLGALQAGGKTIAVLGCGLDVVYPSRHKRLYKQIQEQGVLLSEYPLGTPPQGFRFPARNRIVSGLSLGVVIVEAAIRSGALITARLALEQNREVFAVPGRIDSPKSEGPHNLLRQGAGLVRSAKDILAELPFPLAIPKEINSSAYNSPTHFSHIDNVLPEKKLDNNLSEEEKKLLNSIKGCAMDIEQLGENSGLSLTTLHGLLLGLELKGWIRQLPGQQYERV